jgi:hypothetical protein
MVYSLPIVISVYSTGEINPSGFKANTEQDTSFKADSAVLPMKKPVLSQTHNRRELKPIVEPQLWCQRIEKLCGCF